MSLSTTLGWIDIDITTAPTILNNPINIQRFPLPRPVKMKERSTWYVRVTDEDNNSHAVPSFKIDRTIIADAIVKFEIKDDFGFDVGIGFVLGQSKKDMSV